MPGMPICTVFDMAAKPPGPAQEMPAPLVILLAVSRMLVCEQVSVPPPLREMSGTLVLATTLAVALAVQPLGVETVRVYAPKTVTVVSGTAALKPPGPDQEKVAPGALLLP